MALRIPFPLCALILAVSLAACSSISGDRDSETSPRPSRFLEGIGFAGNPTPLSSTKIERDEHQTRPQGHVEISSAADPQTTGSVSTPAALTPDGKKFQINFVDTELQEFVRVVFDEILRENVVIDPALKGRITVRTSAPVSKSAALDLIKNVLAVHGAGLAQQDGLYRISASMNAPATQANKGAFRVIPLGFIDAEQARNALQPFGASASQIASLPGGRTLVLSAPEIDLDRFTQVLSALDVDELKGKSFALFPLQQASATAVARELNTMFGGEGGRSLQALPVERMNAVLLVTRSTNALGRAREWLTHLDQAGNDKRAIRVYPVQNRRAAELAEVLRGMLSGAQGDKSTVAPGLKAATTIIPAKVGPEITGSVKEPETGSGEAASASTASGVMISADAATNSLIVAAEPDEYVIIERAIRRLDIMPTQVLIEATIAEVALNDKLRHGVRWYFEHNSHSVLLSDKSGADVSPVLPGFNYIFSIPYGRLVIDALEDLTSVEIISSPALTVLDNEIATLKVGDQVPIATRSAKSVLDPDAPVVNDIEMKDTGVILSVRPRVNANGLVQLDISQEISDVVVTTTSAIDSPTIRQRAITSTIVVQGGSEIVLGGMISQRRDRGRSGIPILQRIPILGELATSNARRDKSRTELLIIIKPIVLTSNSDVAAVTREIKSRMIEVAE